MLLCCLFFLFFKQKTAYEMRISDWSSDVCSSDLEPINKIENYGVSLQADWNVGALTVTSITAYRKLDNFFDQDVDFTSADIVSEIRNQNVDTFTQELRIASDFDGPINFLLGGYYFDESIDQTSDLNTGPQARQFFELLAGGLGTIGRAHV